MRTTDTRRIRAGQRASAERIHLCIDDPLAIPPGHDSVRQFRHCFGSSASEQHCKLGFKFFALREGFLLKHGLHGQTTASLRHVYCGTAKHINLFKESVMATHPTEQRTPDDRTENAVDEGVEDRHVSRKRRTCDGRCDAYPKDVGK